MDSNTSYSLVVLPPEQGTLVPVASELEGEDDITSAGPAEQPNLWCHCCCQLALLFWLLLDMLRQLRLDVIELRCQANYWQAQHGRAVEREKTLTAKVQQLNGEICKLKQRLFGRTSESSSTTKPDAAQTKDKNKDTQRERGQQPGGSGHGRRNHDHLPTEHEECDLPDDQKCCGACGKLREEIPGTADGDILEIDVRAHRRRYHRKRYRCTCTCGDEPAVVTAPPPPKLIPKSNLGVSLWVMILTRKFQFFQPLHRILAELRGCDLDLPAGTITGGLHKLVPLFEPLYEQLVEHNRQENHWHCDETRWRVFEKKEGKAGFNWMLWVFAAKESVVFVLDPTRAHDVPENHLGDDAEGIMNVDRYSAYKAMAQVKDGKIILSFCWAHVRRDFLAVLTGWTELTDWAWSWVEAIGLLYHLNDKRLSVLDDADKYIEADQLLRDQVEDLRQRRDEELAQPELRQPQRKALTSLQEHWSGLMVFVDHPDVPMDNNKAERCHRGPVVGRKNFYGSGAIWSGRLAAMLFSLFQTIAASGMDVGRWLTAYLTICAKAGGKPPPDPERYLPWNMSPEERRDLSHTTSKPPAPTPSDPEANEPTSTETPA